MKKRLRYIFASIVAGLLIAAGFTRRAKRKAKNGDFILSIYFHAPSKTLFKFCIRWLKKNHFKFLSQQDIIFLSENRKPFPKAGVIITVDDGWKSNEENIVTIAKEFKIPVTIFVSSDPIEKGNFWWPYIARAKKMKLIKHSVETLKKVPNKQRIQTLQEVQNILKHDREALTINQVRQIASSEYITIGSHTVSHPILINCNDEEVYFELKESKEKIGRWINKDVNCFAYPNGDYGEREMKYLKETGYSLAYTTQTHYLTEDTLNNLYELPRFTMFENISKAEAICRMLGLWQSFFKIIT